MTAWEADFQTTIDAWQAGTMSVGQAACERLLRRNDLPEEILLHTQHNATFYLRSLAKLAPSYAARPLKFPVPDGWSRFNPTVAHGPQGLSAIVRSGNYTVDEHGQYMVIDDDGVVRSANYLLQLRPDGTIEDVNRIDDEAARAHPTRFPVTGLEDCRLIWRNGSCWASATRREANDGGICQMVLLRLDGSVVAELIPLSDGVSDHEKNWMPVVADDPVVQFVYSIAPTVVVKLNLVTREVTRVVQRQAQVLARHIRGGGQVLPVAGG